MDWDETAIKLYVDDKLLGQVQLDALTNPDGFNPFKQPHYILLNLAIGGDNGGDPSGTRFPRRYLVDYVRVYQKNNPILTAGMLLIAVRNPIVYLPDIYNMHHA